MARPQRPHKCSWDGRLVQGLYRCTDGRWRVNATSQKFTEPDERRAVARFEAMQPPVVSVKLPVASFPDLEAAGWGQAAKAKREIILTVPRDHREPKTLTRTMPAAEVWNFLRDELIARPEYVARMVGIPELANLRNMSLLRPSIRVAEIISHYQAENASTDTAKRACVRHFNRFVAHAGAKTLADLSKDKIHAFRQSVEQDEKLKSAGTKQWMYGQIKSIISFGLKCPMMDAAEIRACLDRCKLLWTADAPPPVQPKPIKRDDLHALLKAAGAGPWRAWLLMGINCAMYIEELCGLEWTAIDLERGTLSMIRNKTRRERIPKVAVLWPETIAAIRALPRGPKYVFTSPHGTRYASSQSRANAFADLRERAELTNAVSFSHLRDGAFTSACQHTTDGRLAKILAGHSAGMEDNYVLRNPEIVRPACDAVYRAYGPFPAMV